MPGLLLLHGFPSSSHMFRDLIPLLADRFHIVAPDLPGFGRTAMPGRDKFEYTFDNLARVMDRFTEFVGLDRFAIYVFDYGAPTGFRIALRHPERITAIITQNGNAYEEGLSDGWDPIRAYWQEPSPANREALRAFLTPETTLWQYTHGVTDATAVSPDGYSLDDFYLARPGADEIQLDLFLDYASNVALYPAFQDYFRKHRPPLLAVWGRTIPSSCRPAPRRSSATSRTPTSASSTPATSRSRPTPSRSRKRSESSSKHEASLWAAHRGQTGECSSRSIAGPMRGGRGLLDRVRRPRANSPWHSYAVTWRQAQ